MGMHDGGLLRLATAAAGLIVLATAAFTSPVTPAVEDKNFWAKTTGRELEGALKLKWNNNLAKNVVIFIGDGMGPTTVTAARIYKGKGNEQASLTFDGFPHIGLLKTYCSDKQVPDSASTATALFCGVKGNYHTSGVDANVPEGDCEASSNPDYQVPSLLAWAQEARKDTGFVTTTRVTHATPSALYAHAANRNWECDKKTPKNCKDIARQLIEDEPGKNFKVIMGGGRQCLVSNVSGNVDDRIDTWACYSQDGRDLIQDWQDDKERRKVTYAYLRNNSDLWSLKPQETDYVLGIFANTHLKYEYENADSKPSGMPTLKNMTIAALQVLQRNPLGFVLVVEGGLIDYAHHRGVAQAALYETVAMDEAIAAVIEATDDSETLIIVTSDHSHSLAMTGYPDRGSSITGLAGISEGDKLPYTTLSYVTGDREAYHYAPGENGTVVRKDPTEDNYESFDYHNHAGILTDEALHGGSDVAVYAKGPMAHLFHSVHEQTYVAHVAAYASRIGPYFNSTSIGKPSISTSIICFSFSFLFLYFSFSLFKTTTSLV